MREIVLDTETTGLDPYQGHRMVEIGCLELVNRFPSGKVFHKYLNPERDMPVEAFNVHGLSAEFLRDKPFFHEICEELVEFIGDSPLVAHNAQFRSRLPQCRVRAVQTGADRPRAAGRYAAAGAAPASGRPQRARSFVPTLRDRQFAADQARRAARCRASGRSLYRDDRRPADLAHPGRGRACDIVGRGQGGGGAAASDRAAAAALHGGARSARGVHRHDGRESDLAGIRRASVNYAQVGIVNCGCCGCCAIRW